MEFSVFKKVLIQLLGAIFVFAVVIASSVYLAVEGPARYSYSDDSWGNVATLRPIYNESKYNIVLDQHSHTIYSDGSLTVRQNIEWHIAMGYNTIVITDHNNLNNNESIAEIKAEYLTKGILIIQGMEWTTGRIHMNFLGLTNWSLPISSQPTNLEIQEAIAAAHAQGAVVTCNHIPWSINQAGMDNHPSREQLAEWGIDFIEIVNDDSVGGNVYDAESIPFCESNNIGQITGTDMHRPDELDSGAVHGWTLIAAENLTESAVMDQLRLHNTSIIYDSEGVQDFGQYTENDGYAVYEPLIALGDVFVPVYLGDALNWNLIGMIFMWFIVYFTGFEILIGLGQSLKKKISKKKQ